MLDPEADALRTELLSLFREGLHAPLPDRRFDELARRSFAFQFEHNAPYAAYCRRRGRSPENIRDWRDIPAVPAAAFKEVRLVSGTAAPEALFRTSGTTLGFERRGEHAVLDLSLYHGSLLPNFAAHVLPDDAVLPMLSLIPPAAEIPDSSLSHMVSVVVERLGAPGSAFHASVARGIDEAALERALDDFVAAGQPVCLLGTSLAFVHWLESLGRRGRRFRLPDGSRLMDTGGFKGHERQIAEGELRGAYEERLGIGADHCVNEYGMTEMLSQFYDTVLRDRVRGAAPAGRDGAPRRKGGPPWVRTVVVDPETLEPLPPGETGLLRHYDLANLGSVIGIQTEDLGREVEGGFLLLGRAAGATPRGCSIAMDLLLRAARDEAP